MPETEAEPETVSPAKAGEAVVAMSWAAFKVIADPRDTAPPPVNPVPAVTVKLLLASSVLPISLAGRAIVPEATVNPVRPVRVPVAEIFLEVTMFPVLASPRVRDCIPVVAMVAAELKVRFPEA